MFSILMLLTPSHTECAPAAVTKMYQLGYEWHNFRNGDWSFTT